MADTPTGETDPNAAPENNANPTPPAASGNEDWKAKYEASQKEVQQITLERNLLRNKTSEIQVEADKKVEAATKAKEEAEVKLSTLSAEMETSKKQEAIQSKKAEVLKDYPDGVRELADDLGIDLTDAEDEDAVKSFTAKLDKIKERVESSESGEGTPPAKPKPPKVSSGNSSLENREQPEKTEEQEMAELSKRLEGVTF